MFPLPITPEAPALQALVYGAPEPLVYRGTVTPRSLGMIGGRGVKAFPLGDELMALLGSPVAEARLDATDERNYEGYARAFAAARAALLAPPDSLPARHIQLLRRIAGSRRADPGVRLTTALAFWTLHRHLFVLNAKQSYTGVEKGLSVDPAREAGWLEADVEVLAELRSTVREVQRRLPGQAAEPLAAFGKLLDRCLALARDDAAGKTPSAAARAFLNTVDRDLFELIGRADGPLVVDVHTDASSGDVLEEALDWPSTATTRLPSGIAAVGGRLAHREFKRPLPSRLTDEAWDAELRQAADSRSSQ